MYEVNQNAFLVLITHPFTVRFPIFDTHIFVCKNFMKSIIEIEINANFIVCYIKNINLDII